MNRLIPAAVLAACMLLTPVVSLGAETTPVTLREQTAAQAHGEHVSGSYLGREYHGVTASTRWMRQARIGGVMLNLRLYAADGSYYVFREGVNKAPTGENHIRLTLCADTEDKACFLQLDQHAMDVLNRVGITEIAVTDGNRDIREVYSVSELQDIRKLLGMLDKEQLCVGGESDPVTIVGVDGVRRNIGM